MRAQLRTLAAGLAIALAALGTTPALAGRSCETKPMTAQAMERGLVLAERTWQALEAEHAREGTNVVLLARAGQDLSRYGLRWSHMGIAYRSEDGQGRPAWRVVHKLNQCGTAEASVYRQGLGEFFLDDPWRHETAWVTPNMALQTQLLAFVRQQDTRVTRMHQKPYSLVSYAWGVRYQQSNQWALETLAAAADPQVQGRGQAQAWLRHKGYEPTALRLGALTRLGGRISAANVAFDDHPNEKRFSDRIETVTVDSVFAWLQRTGQGSAAKFIAL